MYLFRLKWCSICKIYQNNLVFPTHLTIKLYLSLYVFVFFYMSLYLAAWLAFHLCQNRILDTPKLPDLFYFLISYFVILLSHSGWTSWFYFISFPVCPHIYCLSNAYHLTFSISFSLLPLCFMSFFLSKNSQTSWSQDQRFILMKNYWEFQRAFVYICYICFYLMYSKLEL